MFMILMLHANMFSIGLPDKTAFQVNPLSAFARIFFEAFSVGGVDLFVIISGWFGIRYSNRGLCKFLYQSFFIVVAVTVVGWILGEPISGVNILHCIFFSELWFVVVYGVLFIIAPVLNAFVDQTTEKQFRVILVTYFIYQTYFGILRPGDMPFAKGFTAISFIFLYLLARYVSLHGRHYLKNGKYIWFISVLLITCLFFVARYIAMPQNAMDLVLRLALNYNSPIVIGTAIGALMMVSNTRPRYSGIINFIAASSFSVYLIHMGVLWTLFLYKDTAKYIFNTWSGIEYLCVISCFMLSVYVIALLLDQLRKLSWDIISRRIS